MEARISHFSAPMVTHLQSCYSCSLVTYMPPNAQTFKRKHRDMQETSFYNSFGFDNEKGQS